MVYSVEDFNSDNDTSIKSITHEIDVLLQKQGYASFHLTSVSKFSDKRDVLYNRLGTLYIDAGWKVKRSTGSDQRDGTWDIIELRRP